MSVVDVNLHFRREAQHSVVAKHSTCEHLFEARGEEGGEGTTVAHC